MPRTPIRDKTIDAITDDGSILMSVAKGEQIHFAVTLEWLTDLTGYTMEAKVVEALNVLGDGVEPPLLEAESAQVTSLTILDDTVSDNQFKVVIPDDLCDEWSVQPTPDDPAYGYFALSVADTGTGDAQQIFVPLRGLVEVRYNPLETT